MGSLFLNLKQRGLKTIPEMAVVFPNIPQDHFLMQSAPRSAFRTPQVDMMKFYQRKETQALGKVRVEWPSHLTASDAPSTSWLAARKAEADKRQQERIEQENQTNPWLAVTRSQAGGPPANLAELVRKGLLQAAGKKEEEEVKKKIEERVPYPMCEDVSMNLMKNDPMDTVMEKFSNPWFSKPVLPVPKMEEPWNPPKSMVSSVREGLLKAKEAGWETEKKFSPRSMLSNTQVDLSSWLSRANENPEEDMFMTPVKGESSSAFSLSSSTPRGSVFNLESSSLEQWMKPEEDQEVQSEGSIITLTNSDVTIEDFDDFSDMEHELSQWISKA